MLKANVFTGQEFRCKVFSLANSIFGTIVLKAFVSTNTAILRGIRKSNPGAKRSESRTKYIKDRAGGFSSKSQTLSAKREYPKARSGFGSKYSGYKTWRSSAEPHKFSTEQKYPEARRDSRSKYSGDKKGRSSAEPHKFSTEQKYPEARRDSRSKYSGDKNGRFSTEPHEVSTEPKYSEARRDFRSKFREAGKARFSAVLPPFNAEQKYPGAYRGKFGSRSNGESGDWKKEHSTESRTFSAEKRDTRWNKSETVSKYDGDRKEGLSGERRTFPSTRSYPRVDRDDPRPQYDEIRNSRSSAESRTSAEEKYARVKRDDPESKYSANRKGRFFAESQTFTAGQSYSGPSRSQPGFKSNRDKEKELLAAYEHIRNTNPTRYRYEELSIGDDIGDDQGTRSQEGYLRRGATESESSRKPRSSSSKIQNIRERSDTSQGKAPSGYSLPSSAAGSEPTRKSTRMAAYTDSIDQSDGSQKPEQRRYQREHVPELSIRFNGPKPSNYDADLRYPSTPVTVFGLDVKSNPPSGIPYTTSASEFLYGTSVVTAALKFSRRKLYKVYVYTSKNRSPDSQDGAVRELALAQGIEVINVTGTWLQLLDRMSDGRPHNGYVLEASPLPTLPVTGLQRVHSHQRALKVSLDHQSREEEAINGTNEDIQFQPAFPRYPFVLLLAGVVDPGNLGAIIRSAFLFGVDAIAISKRASAPLSPIVLKASAGAAESLPLLSVKEPVDFIKEARSNGWKIYAAMPSQSWESWKRGSCTNHSLGRPILDHPCVLMIGAEGQGLARPLQRMADMAVNVEGARMGQGGVDSLNASVATAILCDAFLRKDISRPPSEEIATGEAGGDDPTLSDHTSHVDLNEEDPELGSNVIPDRFNDDSLGEEQEATVDELVAIDETKTYQDLDDESVSAPKDRLF
ncbi:hypothetical protein MMC29_006824 [Sticta canariensis]|nr:hypothetical protein [Sticta canariensis]